MKDVSDPLTFTNIETRNTKFLILDDALEKFIKTKVSNSILLNTENNVEHLGIIYNQEFYIMNFKMHKLWLIWIKNMFL